MKRGEIWTVQGSSYASKPRPVLIVQSDEVSGFDSTVLCLITSFESEGIPTRVAIEPSPENGLRKRSWVMTDKIYSSRKDELGERLGTLTAAEMKQVSTELAKVLGLQLA